MSLTDYAEHRIAETPGPRRRFSADDERKSERILAEYLRAWGLRDPGAVAAQCRRWWLWAEENAEAGEASGAVLRHAEQEMDSWIDHLCLQIVANADEAAAIRGSVAVALQAIIDEYPDALLRLDKIPSDMLHRLEAMAYPVAPPTRERSRMQGPPLGELPPLLQPNRWWTIAHRVAAAVLIVTRARSGR